MLAVVQGSIGLMSVNFVTANSVAGDINVGLAHSRYPPNWKNTMLKKICFVLAFAFAGSAFAQGATCTATAAEKKLAGAAKNSFLKKCEKDAAAHCDITSKEKKLAGAAKNSFSKKCVSDAVGAAS